MTTNRLEDVLIIAGVAAGTLLSVWGINKLGRAIIVKKFGYLPLYMMNGDWARIDLR